MHLEAVFKIRTLFLNCMNSSDNDQSTKSSITDYASNSDVWSLKSTNFTKLLNLASEAVFKIRTCSSISWIPQILTNWPNHVSLIMHRILTFGIWNQQMFTKLLNLAFAAVCKIRTYSSISWINQFHNLESIDSCNQNQLFFDWIPHREFYETYVTWKRGFLHRVIFDIFVEIHSSQCFVKLSFPNYINL